MVSFVPHTRERQTLRQKKRCRSKLSEDRAILLAEALYDSWKLSLVKIKL